MYRKFSVGLAKSKNIEGQNNLMIWRASIKNINLIKHVNISIGFYCFNVLFGRKNVYYLIFWFVEYFTHILTLRYKLKICR